MPKGILFVLPCVIGEDKTAYSHLPICLESYIESIDYFIVENTRTARRFIKKVVPHKNIDATIIFEINKHEYEADYSSFFTPLLKQGVNIGLLSESGIASIADPGFHITKKAQELDIKIVPISGPSSITLALSASGLNGQSFAFNGYLPIEPNQKTAMLKQLEKKCFTQTQLFIEAPYRNQQLLELILKTCHKNTRLCIASNISTDQEIILTKEVKHWSPKEIKLHKIPTIFLIGK